MGGTVKIRGGNREREKKNLENNLHDLPQRFFR